MQIDVVLDVAPSAIAAVFQRVLGDRLGIASSTKHSKAQGAAMNAMNAVPKRVQQLLGCSMQEPRDTIKFAARVADDLQLQSGLVRLFTSSARPQQRGCEDCSQLRSDGAPSLFEMLASALRHVGLADATSQLIRRRAAVLELLSRPGHPLC